MNMAIVICLVLVMCTACGKPQQMQFTNFRSHAAVTGACTAVGIAFLRELDQGYEYNEALAAILCTSAITLYKEGHKDSVWDWGDVIANASGAAVIGFILYHWRW